MPLHLQRTNPQNPDFLALVQLLDAGLKITDGEEHEFYDQFNKLDSIHHAIVAYRDGQALGCGAFKAYEEGTAEIKRMFVRGEARGQGVASQILAALEIWAAEEKYQYCILETGVRQVAAVHLYQNRGYKVIPNYGQYTGLSGSICMKKQVG